MENKLVVIEGIDGSGKGTQLNILLKYLSEKNIDHASFDFPQYGKTFFGNFAGRFLNGEFGHFNQINPYLASFPYAADRWQVKDKIWKAINEDKLVVCNRYTPSSIYQAVKIEPKEREKFLKWVETLEYEIFSIPRPSLIIFLYVPLTIAQTLIAKKTKDQYEKNVDYLKKVESTYLEIVKNNSNWVKVDCTENNQILLPEIIHDKIIEVLVNKGYIPTKGKFDK